MFHFFASLLVIFHCSKLLLNYYPLCFTLTVLSDGNWQVFPVHQLTPHLAVVLFKDMAWQSHIIKKSSTLFFSVSLPNLSRDTVFPAVFPSHKIILIVDPIRPIMGEEGLSCSSLIHAHAHAHVHFEIVHIHDALVMRRDAKQRHLLCWSRNQTMKFEWNEVSKHNSLTNRRHKKFSGISILWQQRDFCFSGLFVLQCINIINIVTQKSWYIRLF